MVTGPAKKGHNCNQAWRDQGSGTCHPARLEASTHPQVPDCWQQLTATLVSMGVWPGHEERAPMRVSGHSPALTS